MKNLGKRAQAEIVARLKEIRRIATMETAYFGNIGPDAKSPAEEREIDKLIKERTKNWRQAWIIGNLDEIIADWED